MTRKSNYILDRCGEVSSRVATAVMLVATVTPLPDWLVITAVAVSLLVAGTPDEKLLALLKVRK